MVFFFQIRLRGRESLKIREHHAKIVKLGRYENGTILYPWDEFAMGRVCNRPRVLWAELSRNHKMAVQENTMAA